MRKRTAQSHSPNLQSPFRALVRSPNPRPQASVSSQSLDPQPFLLRPRSLMIAGHTALFIQEREALQAKARATEAAFEQERHNALQKVQELQQRQAEKQNVEHSLQEMTQLLKEKEQQLSAARGQAMKLQQSCDAKDAMVHCLLLFSFY